MTTLIATGYETGDLSIVDKVEGTGPFNIISNTLPGPWSDYCLQTDGYTTYGTTSKISHFFGQKTEIVFGVHMRCPLNYAGFEFMDSAGNIQVSLLAQPSGTWVAKRGNAQSGVDLQTSSKQMKANIYYWVTGRILIHDTTGEIDLWVGDEEFINFTGDTKDSTVAGMVLIRLYAGSGPTSEKIFFDDLWVIERTGPHSGAGVYLDEIGISGHRPVDDGDTIQLNRSPNTVTRFYLPSAPTTSVKLETSVIPAAEWDNSTDPDVVYAPLAHKKIGSAMASARINIGVGTNGDILAGVFISEPLAAQTISGTVKGQIRTFERLAADDMRGQLIIRVVSKDGGTVRGTLYAGDTGALASEYALSLTNRMLTPRVPLTLSSVVAQEGDRIVVEIGARVHANNPGDWGDFRFGDAASTDLPENETEANDYNPWIEFSNAIQFLNWANVDEIGHDDEHTYNYENTVNDTDLYQLEDMPAEWPDVKAVVLRANTRQVEPGPGRVALPLKSGGTQNDGSDIPTITAWTWVSRAIDDVDPTDSNPWTRTKVNNLQAGVKIR